jgi:uncharacterized alpha-E superfamily protein
MLSRVADGLMWMGRHIERAENVARMLDVNTQLMLDVPMRQAEKLKKDWSPLVSALGDDEDFRRRCKRTDSATVTHYLAFDRENFSSILSCLASARENGRTVREQISSEMWEQLNRFYLWATSKDAVRTYENNGYDFFQRIREFAYLFYGVTEASMPHAQGWDFIQLGKFLERADKTSRFLDEDFHLVKGGKETPRESVIQWTAVLRSCSAQQAYQQIYVSQVEGGKVADLLLLSDTFPRSVEFCVQQVDEVLRRLSGVQPGRFSNRAEKLSGRLLAELVYSSIDDITGVGLHKAMDDLQTKLNAIGAAIYSAYLHHDVPVEPEPLSPETVAAQDQQQQQQQQ